MNISSSLSLVSPTLLFFLGLTLLPYSLPPPTSEWHRGNGNGICGQFTTCHLCCCFLLILFPCSSMGSHPWEIVLRKLLQCVSCLQAAVLHELLHHVSFLWGTVLQEQTDPVWVPHGVTSPASKHAPAWAALSTGPARTLLQRGLSMGSRPPSGITLLWHGILPRLQVHSLPHHGLLHRLLCSGTWSTSCSSSFFTDLGVCRVVSQIYSYSSLLLQNAVYTGFFPY